MKSMKKLILVALIAAFLPLSLSAQTTEDYLNSDSDSDFDGEAFDYGYGNNNEIASDPLEGFNRGVNDFNNVFDRYLLDPVAETYSYVLPRFAQNRVYHFLDNIEAPVVFANSLMQGDAQNTFVTFWRFIFNTTLGVAGLFDMATEMGVPPRNHEDFGQTMGVWGVGHGAYLVMPFFGPSSLRDAPGKVVDVLINPFTYALKPVESIAIGVTQAVDSRARFDERYERIRDSSLDPYTTFRSLYLQRRAAMLVNNADKAQDAPF